MLVSRALISVYDKKGLVEFARGLNALGIEIVSSGGTAKTLRESGLAIIDVSSITGSPEMMDGRVKTLHPKIHGAILADRSNKQHMQEAKTNGIEPIDMVVVNLYPFEQTIKTQDAKPETIIENIDIGGPALIRAAAKNYKNVAVVCDPADYTTILESLKKSEQSEENSLDEKTLERLAVTAWMQVAHYDTIIEQHFRKSFGMADSFPQYMNLTFDKKQDLRYGENPHQRAALYHDDLFKGPSILDFEQLQGKQLSYNNVLDCNSAFKLIREFTDPTAVIVKHNNPCGVASNQDPLAAYKRAKAVDPEAAFGGIVAMNRPVDEALAKEITTRFVEIVMAPEFTPDALKVFSKKKNVRVMQAKGFDIKRLPYRRYRTVLGGLLVQEADVLMLSGTGTGTEGLKVVTKRQPTEKEQKAMMYAWKVAKYVRSNAIVYAHEDRAVGIGAGQMKRIDAAKIASMIAADNKEDLKGAAMASDAFFPFPDGIDYAAKLGISAVIQPGGSVNDEAVIAAADRHDMVMIFTGVRHFRH